MPNLTSPEVTSIEAGYEEQVRTLYKTLFANLGRFAAMHGPDLLYLTRDPWP